MATNYDIVFGTMRTPEEEAAVKALYKRLEKIKENWMIMVPAPEFRMTQDKFGQVHIMVNHRMMSYILMAFAKLPDEQLIMPSGTPMPDWFDALMSGQPYVTPSEST